MIQYYTPRKYSLVLAAMSLFLPIENYAQDILWEKSYGGIHSEYLFDAQPTADYGFILAGSSLSGKTGNKQQDNINNLDYWIWKMDPRSRAIASRGLYCLETWPTGAGVPPVFLNKLTQLL